MRFCQILCYEPTVWRLYPWWPDIGNCRLSIVRLYLSSLSWVQIISVCCLMTCWTPHRTLHSTRVTDPVSCFRMTCSKGWKFGSRALVSGHHLKNRLAFKIEISANDTFKEYDQWKNNWRSPNKDNTIHCISSFVC